VLNGTLTREPCVRSVPQLWSWRELRPRVPRSGGGSSIIAGQRYDWELGETFVVPAWAWHEHSSSQGDAVLVSLTNRPILQAIGLEHEEALERGHQK